MARISEEKLKEVEGKIETICIELEGNIAMELSIMLTENEVGELPLSKSVSEELRQVEQKVAEALEAANTFRDSLIAMMKKRK